MRRAWVVVGLSVQRAPTYGSSPLGCTGGSITVVTGEVELWPLCGGEVRHVAPGHARCCRTGDGALAGPWVIATEAGVETGACSAAGAEGPWRAVTAEGTHVVTCAGGVREGAEHHDTAAGVRTMETTWRAGREDGTRVHRAPDGTVSIEYDFRSGVVTGVRRDGVDCGTGAAGAERCTMRDRDGHVRLRGVRDAGAALASWRSTYPGGEVMATFATTGSIAAGIHALRLEGELEVWYRSGQAMVHGWCARGERHGTWRSWHPGGEIHQRTEYADGRPTAFDWRDPDGRDAGTAMSGDEVRRMRAQFSNSSCGCQCAFDLALTPAELLVQD